MFLAVHMHLECCFNESSSNGSKNKLSVTEDVEMLPDWRDRLPAKNCCFGRKLSGQGVSLSVASLNPKSFH